jgi:hypothetical protein
MMELYWFKQLPAFLGSWSVTLVDCADAAEAKARTNTAAMARFPILEAAIAASY